MHPTYRNPAQILPIPIEALDLRLHEEKYLLIHTDYKFLDDICHVHHRCAVHSLVVHILYTKQNPLIIIQLKENQIYTGSDHFQNLSKRKELIALQSMQAGWVFI